MFLFLLSRVAVCAHTVSQKHVNVKSRKPHSRIQLSKERSPAGINTESVSRLHQESGLQQSGDSAQRFVQGFGRFDESVSEIMA